MPTMTVTLPKTKTPVVVSSYTEASRLVCEDRKRRGCGSTWWYRQRAGQICIDGVQVAFVSYNGRVWRGVEDFQLGHEEIPV